MEIFCLRGWTQRKRGQELTQEKEEAEGRGSFESKVCKDIVPEAIEQKQRVLSHSGRNATEGLQALYEGIALEAVRVSQIQEVFS